MARFDKSNALVYFSFQTKFAMNRVLRVGSCFCGRRYQILLNGFAFSALRYSPHHLGSGASETNEREY